MSTSPEIHVVRPIEASDLEGFFALAEISGPGFTSLQTDRKYLSEYIQASEESFANPDVNLAQKFLLVMEEVSSGKIIGCAAVKTKIGTQTPFVDLVMKDGRGEPVNDERQAVYLDPASTFDGATEVGSLFMHPDHRKGGLGRYLAKSRYLLIGTSPEVFSSPIIAELRGMQDVDGKSPFYTHQHRDRLQKTFEEADEFITNADTEAWKSVVPTSPIVVENLPPQVRDCIGQPHRSGVGAYHLLRKEGFVKTGVVDLFDAGPIMMSDFENISTIRESVDCRLNIKGQVQSSDTVMIGVDSLSNFRAVIGSFESESERVSVTAEAAIALNVQDGSQVKSWTAKQSFDESCSKTKRVSDSKKAEELQ